jgi:hypothetical protein
MKKNKKANLKILSKTLQSRNKINLVKMPVTKRLPSMNGGGCP